MSAPWQVWAGRNGYIGWEPKPELRVDGLHRYIRADQQCEECENQDTPEGLDERTRKLGTFDVGYHPCPHAYWDDEFGTWREVSGPACVAIKPKEVQR